MKINVGNARTLDGNGRRLDLEESVYVEIHLCIEDLLEAIETPEVQLSLRNFVGKGGKACRSVKLIVSKLEPAFANKYQTHSVRIDTYFRPKQ